MEEKTLSDFINCDIRLKNIVQIYHKTDKKWKRNCYEKRDYEGLLFLKKGGIHYDFDGFSFDAMRGDVVKLPSGIRYGGKKIGQEDNEFYVIDFLTESENEFLYFPLPNAFHVADFGEICNRFSKIEKVWNDRRPLFMMQTKNMISELLTSLTEEYMNKCYGVKNDSKTIKICEYISENAFNSELKISEVASKFYISETHLRRLFKEEMKISPVEYLNDIRMKKAVNLLLTKDTSVCEIAELCGYNSVYYFSYAFKNKMGISCREYREEARKRHSLE